MTFTLAFLASIILLLPGLAALAAYNARSNSTGARRAEAPLISTGVLVAAAMLAIFVHLIGGTVAHIGWAAASNLHNITGLTFGPIIREPFVTVVALGAVKRPGFSGGGFV